MTDETEARLRAALALPPQPADPFVLSVVSAHHRTRERRQLRAHYAAIVTGAFSIALAAPAIAAALSHAPAAVSTGAVGLLLLIAVIAWSSLGATKFGST